MKRNILLLALLLAFIGINAQETEKFSPFVGRWRWSENIDSVQYFCLNIGERNDSILIMNCTPKVRHKTFGVYYV
ncbi:MAG: hypothetical protein IKL54_05295 [Bacteroidaceae bacterium]|nr:hypothetical protein [Bacteroidaceae bacterium]